MHDIALSRGTALFRDIAYLRDVALFRDSALLLAALALMLWPGRPVVSTLRGSSRRSRQLPPRARRAVTAGVGGVAVVVLLAWPGWLAPLLGGGAAAIVALLPERQHRLDEAEMRCCAAVFDALAACLDAGLGIEQAMASCLAAQQPDGRVGTALARTSAMLDLGSDPQTAWRPVARYPPLAALAHAASRAAEGGLRLADAARETAAHLRSQCDAEIKRRAPRAGIAMTAPLAVCFLPAFVCLGLAPVVISLLGSLSIW